MNPVAITIYMQILMQIKTFLTLFDIIVRTCFVFWQNAISPQEYLLHFYQRWYDFYWSTFSSSFCTIGFGSRLFSVCAVATFLDGRRCCWTSFLVSVISLHIFHGRLSYYVCLINFVLFPILEYNKTFLSFLSSIHTFL